MGRATQTVGRKRRPPVPTRSEERTLAAQGYTAIAGVDEVGRGPLAGPVVAGAVILPWRKRSPWMRRLRDSKALTARQRGDLAAILREETDWGIGVVPSEEIDRVGIMEGTRQAMLRALAALSSAPDHVLLDGRPVYLNGRATRSIIRGDALCISISAASIVAKVARDAMMEEEEERFPGYGFAKHKGYCTSAHMEALSRLGPCPIHRRSFAPVSAMLPSAPVQGALV